jgi:outer membrane protein assembly factor BamB
VLRFELAADRTLRVVFSTPAIHVWESPLGIAVVQANDVRIGPLTLAYDRAAGTLSGIIPAAFVPVHQLRATFRRTARFDPTPRPDPSAPIAEPVWVYDAEAPIWADVTFTSGTVLAGADDGRLHAIDARTGKSRWTFRAGGAVRARATVFGDSVFIQADDGLVYRLDANVGVERWRVRVMDKPVTRLSPGDSTYRYNNRTSGANLINGRLYVGTQDGRVVAIDATTGVELWNAGTGDAVVSTPAVAAGRVYAGSFDGKVYALDAATGAQMWTYDTGAPVTSAPALYDGLVIVGSRSYDLVALDAATGRLVWTRYYWYSWVESSASIFGGVAYIGSSDAAKLFAFDARSGRRVWEVDAAGSAWAQPAVSASRVYIGSVGTLNYMVPHRAMALAVDRETGRPVWHRFALPPAGAPGSLTMWGFAGSPALGAGLVFFGSLDGRVYAFRQ